MIQQRNIAKKYAAALYEVALELGQLEVVGEELLNVEKKLSDNSHYKKLMFSRIVPCKVKQMFINTALNELNLGQTVKHFVSILTINNRNYLLNSIIDCFKDIVLDHNGVLQAEITICGDDNELSAAIKQQLGYVSGKKILLETIKSEAILGGFVLKVHNKVIDYSLKNKLNKLKKILG